MSSPSRVFSVTKLYESLFRCRVTVTICCRLEKFTFNSSRMHVSTFPTCVNLSGECISSVFNFRYKGVLQGHLLICCSFLHFFTVFLYFFLRTDYLICYLLLGSVFPHIITIICINNKINEM